jgi:tetratricopeptide (TPR) repeat protein
VIRRSYRDLATRFESFQGIAACPPHAWLLESRALHMLRGRIRKCARFAVPVLPVILCMLGTFVRSALPQSKHHSPASQTFQGQTRFNAGMVLVHENRVDEAISAFERGLEVDPHNAMLLNATGAAYSLKGAFEKAIGCYLAALQVDAKFVPARKNLAITYFNLGQYNQAEVELRTLQGTPGAPKTTVALFLGMVADKSRDYAGAVRLLDQAGTLLQRYPEALLSLADASLQLKQSRRAEAALHSFETRPGVTASQYLKAGELYAAIGHYQAAFLCFDKARVRDRYLDGLAYQRAVVLDRMNRPQEAEAILKGLVTTKPDSAALNLLAHVAEKDKDFVLAMESLRQAAKLDPTKEENYLDFSTICADYGNYALALEAAEIGLNHVPASYRLLVQKGVVLENLGRLDEAEGALQEASRLQDENSVALLSLAIVQTHAGQLKDADATLTGALRRFPTNYYMHYQRGKILVQLKESGEGDPNLNAQALDAFQSAIRLRPSFADAYYQLAKLIARDRPRFAEQNLATCLRLDPDHAPAEYSLARIYLSTGRRAAGQALINRFEDLQQKEKRKQQQEPRIEAAQR